MNVAVSLAAALTITLATAGILAAELERAEEALERGDWETAESLFREQMRLTPLEPRAVAGLARSLEAQGRRRDAATVLVGSADTLLARERFADAAALLELAHELDPGSAVIAGKLGRAEYRAGRFAAAIENLQHAVALGRSDLTSLLYLGSSHWEIGAFSEAEARFREAAERFPASWLPLFSLGRLLSWRGQYAEAVDILQKVAALAPPAADIQLELARAHEGVGNHALALEAYRRAASIAPDDHYAHYGLAKMLRLAGDEAAAAAELAIYQDLVRAIEDANRRKGLERARIAHGMSLLRAGDVEAAIEHFEALAVSPDMLVALATAYEASGRWQEALDAIGRAVSLDPARKDLRDQLLEMRLRAGDSG